MKLKQSIGQKTLLMIILNGILGTGIFFLPAVGAAYSGYASLSAWIVMSLIAVVMSLYFAELASMFPKSGGAYEYVRNAFGGTTSFVFGWVSWIVSNITISMLIVGSLIYIFPSAGILTKVILAVAFVLLFNFVNYRGINWSSKMLLFFGVMTVLTLLALIIHGLPTAAVNAPQFSGIFSIPIPVMLLTIYFIAETFFGWETATYLSEEIKNSRKVLPKMLVLSTVIIALISISIVFVSLGNIDPATFGRQAAPIAYLAEKLMGGEAAKIFAFIIFIPLIGTAASWIVSSPRLLYSMSRNKMLLPRFSKLHKKYKTPYVAIIFQTIATILITMLAFGNFIFLLSLLVPLVLIMYCLVMLSVVKLRIDKPKMKRYFSAPFPKAGPIFLVLFNLSLLYIWITRVSDAPYIFLMGLILVFVGLPLYMIMKLQTDKKFVEKFYDRVAFFWDRAFRIWYTQKEIDKILGHLKLKDTSTVLDFGCGSGNTALAISKEVRKGSVVAVDLSEKQLQHAVRKIRKLRLHNVIFIKGNIRFPKKSFDAITAVGVLEHLDKPHKHIEKLMTMLKKGGKFYFLSFGKSFGIPGPEFLENDEKIMRIFRHLSVDVKVSRKNKRFVEYVSIYGVKK